ncbi:SusD/RagB family nutrient-binding outer membrane lipoprotein [Aquimarina gracilis]|uniref:SusD/RagB family nutrient-binding outer membrane lipoprotein n=1 Tax=Aquimarina gracilis TaxID=874422 RepID=A0ABU5ZS03_9FLAO|nr:SusD/RagB family nutrient-binding outer membrane lipoprotein [Aquimarina gracilis]MEB3344418.1 SusD/RagB family nutrient-binding outer membrane lipoprotein [Aquimarina gracilis]
MKNITRNTLNTSKFLVILSLFMSILSCSDYLDVDTDTDNPTVAPINQLLTGIQVNIGQVADFQFFSADILQVYTHQFTAREEQDQYGAKADNVLMNNDWNNVYIGLTDIETLLSQAGESGDEIYVGIAEILKAYLMSVAVDLWGDVPFTEATLLEQGNVSPSFDDQREIYASVLELIDEGKSKIQSGQGIAPSTDDLFYGGSNAQWIKFANTLKLKLFNQIRLSDLFDVAALNALLAEDNFMSSIADDFQFNHTAAQAPADERNRLFLDAYGGAQVTKYASPWFYEILIGVNPNIHTNNPDPRLPYYFVNQLLPGQFPRDQGDSVTGDPNADYWDAATGFFSIRFGSIGPDRDGAVQNDATFPGIFPCGGRYDDGAGFARTINSGTGVAPKRILTYDEFLYIQAELMHEGLMPGDAGAKLREAMTASFAKVDQVVAGTGTSQTVPVLAGSTAVTTFLDNVMNEFNAASDEKKLEIIMTQKWVATFGDPMDQYNDYRRTGYPVLADPNGPSPEYQLDNGDGFPLIDNLTVLNNDFQVSFFWPQRELNLNQNAPPSQKDPTTYKIFWDN